MKLSLNGPQAITIFMVAKDALVPSSARASSFATPQAYYSTESGKLRMFIKGQEYCFIDHEVHTEALDKALKASSEHHNPESPGSSTGYESYTGANREPASAYTDKDVSEMWERWNEIYAKHEELESRLETVETNLDAVHKNIYTPLHHAFHEMLGVHK